MRTWFTVWMQPVMQIGPTGRIALAPGWTVQEVLEKIWPKKGGLPDVHPEDSLFSVRYFRDESVLALILGDSSPFVVRANRDGSVEFGPAFDGDERDRELWRQIGVGFLSLVVA
jgi:hypothetical protein